MNSEELLNPNPTVHKAKKINDEVMYKRIQNEMNEEIEDEVDNIESNYIEIT